jgi:UDP-glucose 4-epimerase
LGIRLAVTLDAENLRCSNVSHYFGENSRFHEVRCALKLLVTGGAGYIGGTVAELLLDRGHNVFILDDLSHGHRSLLPRRATFVQAALADNEKIHALLQTEAFDGVLHFAAIIEAGESMQKPELYFRNNTASTLKLLEEVLLSKTRRFVFSSTAAVYGEPERTPITEDAPLRPTNPYGESKLLVEQMLSWFGRIHHLHYASLRYFNVAGAIPGRGEAHEPESHLIPLILDVALGRRASIRIYGQDYDTPDGTCIRDYIHVSDLAEAHLMALEALQDKPRLIYNLGNGKGFSVKEVIDSVRRVTGRPIPVDEFPRRAGDPAILIASSEAIGRDLGWKPKHSELDSIIASAWEWHQQRYA